MSNSSKSDTKQSDIKNLDARRQQAEKRNLLSSFFITLLIGIAYQEMISVVRESMRLSGITVGTTLLTATFFFTSMRFFVGNQLHLLSDALLRMPGLVWLYDVMVIISQSIALIFLGSSSSIEINRKIMIGFLEFLVVLYIIDIAWIVSQWILGRFLRNWRRGFIPWAWAILNSILVICMLFLNAFTSDIYSASALTWLFGLNLIGFIVDVVLVDYYGALF
ncbi:hypothetical protein L6R21_25020 [bacterium]|nr:hypothetical protein [bacterium]